MEVEIDMLNQSDHAVVNNVKEHDQDVMKPTSDAGPSGSLNSYHDGDVNEEDEDDGMIDDEDDGFGFEEYDDGEDMQQSDNEEDDDSHYLSMQAQFDNVDLPPGVEANFSFLSDTPPAASTSNTHNKGVPSAPLCKNKDLASSSSSAIETVRARALAAAKEEEDKIKLQKNFEGFKLFDIVEDFSDHHFTSAGFKGQQPPRAWTKKIQDEWKILEKDLPGSIFVRAFESRMDLLRAVIVGPAGTPYHDGLFVFDIHFPTTYPKSPPMVHYYSGGLRINPNLYNCGKVCLSLLNTWTGKGSEKWMPDNSTMLQVLVSIQALILNEKPFFNEPGYASSYGGRVGEQRSKEYNESTFILSLKTMIYTIRRPPKHFEDLVIGHFRSRAHTILSACRAYMEGAQVGSTISGGIPINKSNSPSFQATVGKMVNGLVSNFTRYGATDCEKYRV